MLISQSNSIIQSRTLKLKTRWQWIRFISDPDHKRISIMVLLDQIQFTPQSERETINHSETESQQLPRETFLWKSRCWIPLEEICWTRRLPKDSFLKQVSTELWGVLRFRQTIKIGCYLNQWSIIHPQLQIRLLKTSSRIIIMTYYK